MVGRRALVTGFEFWVGFVFLVFLFSIGFWGEGRDYRRAAEPFRSDLPIIYNADRGWYEPNPRCLE